MEKIEAIEAEIDQILYSFHLLRSDQCGRLQLDQVVMKDELIADRLQERDRIHKEFDPYQHRCYKV